MITSTGRWPSAMCSSTVSLLAKVLHRLHPTTPAHARPISVLATTFRLWGKIMAAKFLYHFLPHLPRRLYGSMPGRSSMDVAFHLQSLLEDSMLSGDAISGVSVDLGL